MLLVQNVRNGGGNTRTITSPHINMSMLIISIISRVGLGHAVYCECKNAFQPTSSPAIAPSGFQF